MVNNLIGLIKLPCQNVINNTKKRILLTATTMVIILLEFLMFYQIFVSPQVKLGVVISNKLVYTSCLTSCRAT